MKPILHLGKAHPQRREVDMVTNSEKMCLEY
jgi:hypothetical protein